MSHCPSFLANGKALWPRATRGRQDSYAFCFQGTALYWRRSRQTRKQKPWKMLLKQLAQVHAHSVILDSPEHLAQEMVAPVVTSPTSISNQDGPHRQKAISKLVQGNCPSQVSLGAAKLIVKGNEDSPMGRFSHVSTCLHTQGISSESIFITFQ